MEIENYTSMGRPKKCRTSGKVKFITHERALKRAGELLELHPEWRARAYSAYRCPHCNHWHLTTKK